MADNTLMSEQEYKECMVLCGLTNLPERADSCMPRIWVKDEHPIFINEGKHYFYRLIPKTHYLTKQEVMEYIQLYLERGKHYE